MAISQNRSRRHSLKWRLLHLTTAVMFFGLLIAAGKIIDNGRQAIRAEGAGFAKFAVEMLEYATARHANGSFDDADIDNLVTLLSDMRHVRLVEMPLNEWINVTPPLTSATVEAPRWFAWLLTTGQEELYQQSVTSVSGDRKFVVTADFADEIDEVWADVSPLIWLAIGLIIVMWILLYLAVRRALAPLNDLSAGFERLERGDFSEQVREDVVFELQPIHHRFNWMSNVLRQTMKDNSELAARMVILREEERMSLARDLHDELSPHIFNIKMNLATTTMLMETQNYVQSAGNLHAITEILADLEQGVRRMLNRLRPATLDELGLEASLHDLVESWQSHSADTNWTINTNGEIDSLDTTLKVTTYRIVRECLTNVAKHAGATEVNIEVIRLSASPAVSQQEQLRIIVQDNGKGMANEDRPGFGLRGMKERVRSLGGTLELRVPEAGGLCLDITMPISYEAEKVDLEET